MNTYVVFQISKRPGFRSAFAVIEAKSGAAAVREYGRLGLGIQGDAKAARDWTRPRAELLQLNKEYTL